MEFNELKRELKVRLSAIYAQKGKLRFQALLAICRKEVNAKRFFTGRKQKVFHLMELVFLFDRPDILEMFGVQPIKGAIKRRSCLTLQDAFLKDPSEGSVGEFMAKGLSNPPKPYAREVRPTPITTCESYNVLAGCISIDPDGIVTELTRNMRRRDCISYYNDAIDWDHRARIMHIYTQYNVRPFFTKIPYQVKLSELPKDISTPQTTETDGGSITREEFDELEEKFILSESLGNDVYERLDELEQKLDAFIEATVSAINKIAHDLGVDLNEET